ncbi:hypothetical protein HYG86_12965 [Alkalicella caledoniensis]|uniref:Uncharacterized protein n=1 Tax=Alkalicella caledoniensis TaxID=2731377 RepID=A0A7G9WAA7_ALKCA|nr:hypothetical protein [Alkalicella caledoniensis]QNO15619.1 hypothetical protein HYG86_12965 [Alkalicella caledoniensis]
MGKYIKRVLDFMKDNPKFTAIVVMIFIVANIWSFVDKRITENNQLTSFMNERFIGFNFTHSLSSFDQSNLTSVELKNGTVVNYIMENREVPQSTPRYAGHEYVDIYVENSHSKNEKEIKIAIFTKHYDFEFDHQTSIVPVTVIGLGIMVLGYTLFWKKDPYKPSAY